jgi:hypothetical protein
MTWVLQIEQPFWKRDGGLPCHFEEEVLQWEDRTQGGVLGEFVFSGIGDDKSSLQHAQAELQSLAGDQTFAQGIPILSF